MAKYVRKQPFIAKEQKIKRRALLICISGMNVPGIFDGIKKTVLAFLNIIDCPLMDELLVPGMDTLQDISASPGTLDEAYAKGLALGKQVSAP